MRSTARLIVQTLQDHGHQAYWVGGCVRDLLLHTDPKDYDIVTSATPDEVATLFTRAHHVGQAFGITVIDTGGLHFEVATFRTESGYDGRRPSHVEFASLEADAQRRDFTINALYFDPLTDQLIDPHGGRSDLRRGLLRFIGDPTTRLREDHLRLLRAVRFRHRFALTYAPATRHALQQHASLVTNVSAERTWAELTAILTHPSRRAALLDLDALTLLPRLLPELTATQGVAQPTDHHAEGDVWQHTLLVAHALRPEPTPALVWGTLLHDIGKTPTAHFDGQRIRFPDHPAVGAQLAHQLLDRFVVSRQLRHDITWLIRHHDLFHQWSALSTSRQLHYLDHPLFDTLVQVHRADLLGCVPGDPTARNLALERLPSWQQLYYDHLAAGRLPSQLPPLLTGADIITHTGWAPGPRVGKVKDRLYSAQLEGLITDRPQAFAWLTALLAEEHQNKSTSQ